MVDWLGRCVHLGISRLALRKFGRLVRALCSFRDRSFGVWSFGRLVRRCGNLFRFRSAVWLGVRTFVPVWSGRFFFGRKVWFGVTENCPCLVCSPGITDTGAGLGRAFGVTGKKYGLVGEPPQKKHPLRDA